MTVPGCLNAGLFERPPAEIAFVETDGSASDLTTYTFSGMSLGVADAERTLVLCVHGASVSVRTLDSVTVGGDAATEVILLNGTNGGSTVMNSIFTIKIPTGTTADVVVTWSAGVEVCNVAMHRALNLGAVHATNIDNTEVTNLLEASLVIPGGGVGVGHATAGVSATRTWTWTNLTETSDFMTDTGSSSTSAISSTPGSSSRQAEISGTHGSMGMVVASWDKA